MDLEIKGLFEEQAKTFDAFKAANDAMQAEIKKLGSADAVTAEKVKEISKSLDAVADEIKAAARRSDDIEAKMNRAQLAGGESDEVERKAVAEFGRMVKSQVSVDQFREYKAALYGEHGYLRHNRVDQKALSVGSEPDGGFLVTPDTTGRILQKVFETSAMRQYASVTTIGTDALEGLIDRGEATSGWVGEQQTRTETATPQFGKWSISVNEMYAMPRATQKLLDDSIVDLEAWLAMKVADKFARTENTAFVSGDGILKPRGFLTYPTAATADASRAWGTFEHVASGASGAFASSNPSDKLIDLIYALKSAYRVGASFFMARSTVAAVRKLKDGQGNYLWQPSAVAGQPATLMSYPVAEMEDMPAIAADKLAIAFGNMSLTYQIVDRVGIRVLRDPYTTKGSVMFYTTKRTGGDVLEFETLKFMKFATA